MASGPSAEISIRPIPAKTARRASVGARLTWFGTCGMPIGDRSPSTDRSPAAASLAARQLSALDEATALASLLLPGGDREARRAPIPAFSTAARCGQWQRTAGVSGYAPVAIT